MGGSNEEEEILSFYVQLLTQMQEFQNYPFTKMIMEKRISKKEYQELMTLLSNLSDKYQEQKEEGLLHYNPLLIHFAGMLNHKLHPDKVILALQEEGIFSDLMGEFQRIRWRENK